MDLKLKICGMRDLQNIRQVSSLHPNYLGLIFYEASPRYVDEEEIGELDLEIKRTGVFVNASKSLILNKVEKFGLTAIQLHGEESPEFCRDLKKHFSASGKSLQLIKVFGIKDQFNFNTLIPYEQDVDFFLFDTKGKKKGGTGIRFNWEVLKMYPSTVPFFLSGGIGPEEANEIKKLYRHFQENNKEDIFYGIDVNSKFESAPGLKDAAKLKIFRDELFS
jgi:phosphoribosylanthranilate isomerase